MAATWETAPFMSAGRCERLICSTAMASDNAPATRRVSIRNGVRSALFCLAAGIGEN
jgi:hypothetical protein